MSVNHILQAAVGPYTQTPEGLRMLVQIGPGDPISNLPVVVLLEEHQLHEGEGYRAIDPQLSLGTGTVKYGITVATYAVTIRAPHLVLGAEVYNGSVLMLLYDSATFTGGSLVARKNRNRNIAEADTTTITTGVTSTDGTLIDAFYVGSGARAGSSGRGLSEWILKSNTIYRVDMIGQAAGTVAYATFDYYADLGV